MQSSTERALAHGAVWLLIVAVGVLAVVSGQHWAWIVGAAAVALVADAADARFRPRAQGAERGA
jgi:hypothetical protein